MDAPGFIREDRDDTIFVRVKGDWILENGLGRIDKALRQLSMDSLNHNLIIDLDGLGLIDTTGAMMLQRTMRHCGKRESLTDLLHGFEGGNDRQRKLIERAASVLEDCPVDTPRPSQFIILLDRVGRSAENMIADALAITSFLGQTIVTLVRVLTQPKKLRLTSLVHHMEESGLNATLIVGLMSFMIGAVVAFMGAKILSQFNASIFTVELIGISVLREFGVLLTAILIAGRSGSAYTAQLGSMNLNEEIDAMRVIGIDPMEALVVPRVLAMVLVLPALAFIAAMLGLLGGALVSWMVMDISPALFLTRTQDSIVIQNFLVGLVKAPFFAFVIAVIGCYQGMSVEGSSENLGKRTTMSVVQSLFLVIVIDAMFAILFLELDI